MMNKMIIHYGKICVIFSVIIVLLSCAAGGGESGTGEDVVNIPTGQSVTTGIITGFGSVFVNGIEYETSSGSTTVNIEGNEATEQDLKIGMFVSLIGSVNDDGSTGSALSIEFEDNVEGLVLSNDILTNNRLDIMGQTVVVDNDTVFESSNVAIKELVQLEINSIVQVSGYTSGDGTIYATRIELKSNVLDAGKELEVSGIISNLNSSLSTFKIGILEINYQGAILKGFPTGEPLNANFVEVKSVVALNNGQLLASRIKLKKQFKVFDVNSESRDVEFEGVITAIESSAKITVNGRVVFLDQNVEYDEGVVADLALRKKLKIQGVVDQDGNIVAKKIKFRTESKTKLEGLITDINRVTKRITVSGQQIRINPHTRVIDELDGVSERERKYFGFKDLAVNDYVQISVYFDAGRDVYIATKLERDDSEEDDRPQPGGEDIPEHHERWETEGIITAIDLANNTITIGQITIDISNINNFDQNTSIGSLADAKGHKSNGVWIASELEIQNEEEKEPPGKNEPDDLDHQDANDEETMHDVT